MAVRTIRVSVDSTDPVRIAQELESQGAWVHCTFARDETRKIVGMDFILLETSSDVEMMVEQARVDREVQKNVAGMGYKEMELAS